MGGKDILVSGASIAGPALAYWLRRNNLRVPATMSPCMSATIGSAD